jgi:predicted RNA-binding Zn ribbon-like protein
VAAPRVAVLAWTARGAPQREEHGSGGDELDQALGTIAADALELLSGPERVALARCPASGCSRLLLRTHGKRQWCSTRCGDRVRAARHYARTRAAGGRGHP